MTCLGTRNKVTSVPVALRAASAGMHCYHHLARQSHPQRVRGQGQASHRLALLDPFPLYQVGQRNRRPWDPGVVCSRIEVSLKWANFSPVKGHHMRSQTDLMVFDLLPLLLRRT